jgi:serine protease Do
MGPQRWVRADVQLAPGNSGGPLANARGEVVGINTAIANGLALAVPAREVARFVKDGPRPSLGVVLRPIREGLLVLDIDPQGAAANVSLRQGDILVCSFDDLNTALDSGLEVIPLRFVRGGDARRVREVFVQLKPRAEAA